MQTTLRPTSDGRMPYFKQLDGARAYCVLLIMLDHLKSNGHTPGWINGHLGVDLFFIISGFLITTLLWREQVLTGDLDLKAFYLRRIFRIVPAYLVVLAIYVVILQAPSQSLRWLQFKPALPYFLTFMNEFALEPKGGSVFLHTWSLGVEEKFYLAWPMLFFVAAKTARSRLSIIIVSTVVLAISALLGHSYLARAYVGLLTGCIMATALGSRQAGRIFAYLQKLPPSFALAIFAFGFYAEHTSKNLMAIFSAAAALFFASLIARPSWLSRMHEWGPLVWLGKRSYGMYLVHILCLNALESRIAINSGWRAALVLCAAYLISAACADVLYRTVEQPVRNYGRAYLARHDEVAAAV